MHTGFHLGDFHDQIIEDLKRTNLVAVEADEDLSLMYKEEIDRKFVVYSQKYALQPYPDLQKKLSREAWENLAYTLSMDDVRKNLAKAKIATNVHELHPILIQVIVQDLINRQQWYAFNDVIKTRSKNMDLSWMYFDSFNRVDQEVLAFARGNQKEVMALDTYSDEFLDNFLDFEKGALTFIENIFGDNTIMAKNFQDLRANYQNGNEAALITVMEKPGSEKLQIGDRNKRWLSKLKWRLEKDIFAAVGAGHLIGKSSLLLMLEKEGFKISIVEFNKK